MEVFPVTQEIVRSAAVLARDFSVLPYDGVHIATAKEAKCDRIISADKEFDRVNVLKRLDPLDYKGSQIRG